MVANMDEIIDMWYGDRFIPGKYYADAHFNDYDCIYRGNIYDENGKCIGSYSSDNSVWIENNFKIKWNDEPWGYRRQGHD